ncbi:AI-2E family transporter [Pararhodobacter oceanensis]|uniref:AI-2E family transporter n=1 Tax=Pararhodobacter oceanensis TaxID=2172121 RepID=UPI003A91B02E
MDELRVIKNLLFFVSALMTIAVLYVARDLFLPIMIGFLIALTLSPVVRSLARLGIPEALSAVTLVLGAGLVLALGSYMISGPVAELLADVPEMGNELRRKLRGVLVSIEEISTASERVEDLATGADSTPQVALQQPGLLAFAAGSIANFAVLVGVGLVLALFILSSGDLFYVKLVQAFPNYAEKRRAVRTARDVERQISRYFLTILMINAGLGVCIGVAMYLTGLPNPILWGVVAFSLNFVPYIGAVCGAVLVAAFGVLSFDTLGAGLLPAAIYFSLTLIEGQFVTPTVLGRRLEMNPVAVFMTVIIWSWLWSIPGALMAVPFLVLFKVICDNVPALSVVGNFLGTRGANDSV